MIRVTTTDEDVAEDSVSKEEDGTDAEGTANAGDGFWFGDALLTAMLAGYRNGGEGNLGGSDGVRGADGDAGVSGESAIVMVGTAFFAAPVGSSSVFTVISA